MKFEKLSVQQKLLLSDITLTKKELKDLLGIGEATVSRWRKKLGVCVPRGSKKGKARPWQNKVVKTKCKVCNAEFEHLPSKKRKVCSKECSYIYAKTVDRSYMQLEDYRNKKRKDDTPEYTRYKNRVHRLSEKVYQKNIDQINPRGYTRTVAGVEGGYQLDHIVPVRFGFDNNIPEEVMAEATNLRMLPWKKNLERNRSTN